MYAAANPTNTRYNAHIRTTTHGTEYYVLVNSEDSVIPKQQMTSKASITSICIVKNILTSDMLRPECIQLQNVATLVLKLFITIKIGFCYYKGPNKCYQ